MSAMPYGCKGCRCWTDQSPAYGLESETWYPNAMCPHHGLLADYAPERKDTGVYTVVQPEPDDWQAQAGRDMQRIADSGEDLSGEPDDWGPRDLSTPPDGPECPPGVHSMFDFCPGGCLNEATTEEEHGVFATVRRGISRLISRAYWRF